MSNTYGRKVRELQAEAAAERPIGRSGPGILESAQNWGLGGSGRGWQRRGITASSISKISHCGAVNKGATWLYLNLQVPRWSCGGQ